MKKLLVIVLVALLALPVFSQIKFGIKAGVSTTSLSMNNLVTVTSGNTSYSVDALKDARYGFHAGIFLRLGIPGIYIQPELLFATRTNAYSIKNVTAGQTSASLTVKQNFNKMDIPVMVGLKLGPLRLNAGPVASLLINSPKSLINDPGFNTMYSRMTIGYQAGVGVDILKVLTLDLRYEGSLRKYQNQIENLLKTKVNLDDRANAFLLSLGLMF